MGDEPIEVLMPGMGGEGHMASPFPGEADPSWPEGFGAAGSPSRPGIG